jgi:hypothetical protein
MRITEAMLHSKGLASKQRLTLFKTNEVSRLLFLTQSHGLKNDHELKSAVAHLHKLRTLQTKRLKNSKQ